MLSFVGMHNCPKCGRSNTCQAGEVTCWCFEVPHILKGEESNACFCKACLLTELVHETEKYAQSVRSGARLNDIPNIYKEGDAALIEGIDYYSEGETVVMKAWYHLRRGTCCESGCRHCPYPISDNSSPMKE